MRIIAGNWRGRRLDAPEGRDVRPTADRVREALFSALGDRVVGARVLDLFAGSGALGLEALSRGASEVVFVERARAALTVLERNVAALGAGAACRILRREALAALAVLEDSGERFELVFLDPPYASDLAQRSLAKLTAGALLAPGALVVVEHPRDRAAVTVLDLRCRWTRRYGDTGLSLFEALGHSRPAGQEEEEP